MFDQQTTTAIVFTDGYGGLCVLDTSKTHHDVINYMNEESVWEVFDDLSKKPKGKYEATLTFWWELGEMPGHAHEFVIDHEGMKFELISTEPN